MVLSEVSLTIREGRIVVLQGPNGAGKTTLLKVLATRLRPSRGSARVFGFDTVREAHEVRSRTAMLPVFGGSYPTLTGAENLELATRLYGLRLTPSELEAALANVGLAGAAQKQVRGYSSGMKKRLGLARLRMAPAKLWLLDEPYAALDEEGKAYVDALLDEARSTGKTVLLASHEPERVAPLADAVLEVSGGTVRRSERFGVPATPVQPVPVRGG